MPACPPKEPGLRSCVWAAFLKGLHDGFKPTKLPHLALPPGFPGLNWTEQL